MIAFVQYVAFSDWLLLLISMYLRFIPVFSRLCCSFLLALDNLPLSTHLLTAEYYEYLRNRYCLVVPRFLQLLIKL